MKATSTAAGDRAPAPVYFDHNSTTRMSAPAREALLWASENLQGNASNTHHVEGRRARTALEEARRAFATRMDVLPEEVHFTSGGTESNNTLVAQLAAYCRKRRTMHVVVSAIEHKCMLESCRRLRAQGMEVTELAPDREGVIRPDDLRAALRRDTGFVSVMHVNNETGVRQDVRALADVAHHGVDGRRVLFVSDCAQSMGKLHVRPRLLGMDALTCSAHKFGGPKGVGVTYMRADLRAVVSPLLVGGPQEAGARAGTENVPGIVSAAAALKATWDARDPQRVARNAELRRVTDRLVRVVCSPAAGVRGTVLGCAGQRMPHVALVAFDLPGLCNTKLLKALDAAGVRASIGSACNTSSSKASHVLRAMHVPTNLVKSTVRFSVGDGNTVEEAERVGRILVSAVQAQAKAAQVSASSSASAPDFARRRPRGADALGAGARGGAGGERDVGGTKENTGRAPQNTYNLRHRRK